MDKFKNELRKLKVEEFKVKKEKTAAHEAAPVFFPCGTNCGTTNCSVFGPQNCGFQQCTVIGGAQNCQNCANCGGGAGCGGCGVGLTLSCGNCGNCAGSACAGGRGGGFGFRGRF